MIFNYLRSRLSARKFFILSLLFALFILKPESTFTAWFVVVGIMLISFLVFRIVDDIGSVHFDRINHPDRTYLLIKNFPIMLVFGGIILGLYLLSLKMYMPAFFFKGIAGFAFLSIIAYSVFGKNNRILPIIPLLKYPVLLWCFTSLFMEVDSFFLLSSSAFIVGSHDTIEKIKSQTNPYFYLSIVLVLIAGLLIFQPWNKALDVLYILPILISVVGLWRWKYAPYLPLLYFPLAYFISSNYLV